MRLLIMEMKTVLLDKASEEQFVPRPANELLEAIDLPPRVVQAPEVPDITLRKGRQRLAGQKVPLCAVRNVRMILQDGSMQHLYHIRDKDIVRVKKEQILPS